MPIPQVTTQPDAAAHLSLGINRLTDLLAPTLGPVGGLVANQQNPSQQPELLDDAATAVRRVLSLGDPRLDVGAMLLRNVVWRVTQRVGDGGAMTAVLMRAIFQDARRLITAGVNPMIMAHGLRAGAQAARNALADQARPVPTEDHLAAVALSVTRDRELAALLGEIAYLLGADAHVVIEKYVAPYLNRRFLPGTQYRAKIASIYFFTDQARRMAVAAESHLALVDGGLTSAEEAVRLLECATEAGAKGITILASSFGDGALSVLVANHQAAGGQRSGSNGLEAANETSNGRISVLAARLNDVGETLRQNLDDLALLTGCTVLGRPHTRPARLARPGDLALARRVEVGEEQIFVQPQRAANPRIPALVGEIRATLADLPMDEPERTLLQHRLSALNGGMCVLHIGAGNRREIEMRLANAERGLKVLSAAQHGGVVAGAGAALLHCRPALAPAFEQFEPDSDAFRGVEVMHRALAAPLTQILKNAQVNAPGVILERVGAAGPTATFDALSGQVVDAWASGVLDVARVLDLVVDSAVSGAAMALSTDAIVYHRKPGESLDP